MKIDRDLQKLAALKAQIADLDSQRKQLEEVIIASLEKNDTSTISWEDDGGFHKATVVYSTTVKIDAPALLEKLHPNVRKQVTVRVLDEKLLEDKVARGVVDIKLVAKHTTETPRKPFIKITNSK